MTKKQRLVSTLVDVAAMLVGGVAFVYWWLETNSVLLALSLLAVLAAGYIAGYYDGQYVAAGLGDDS
jgi:hypothetical protein